MPQKSNYIVRGGYDASGITRGLAKTQAELKGFQNSVNNTMGKIKTTLIGLGIGKLVKDSMSVAMTTETSIQQINRTMNVHSKEFLAWANTQAIGYGMAKSEAAKYGAVYSNLISGFEGDTKKVSDYTRDLLKSSAVVASGTGRTMEDVMDRIRSGLLGNTESIEDLGINVNIAMIESTEAFKKFANGKSWQQLNFQTQQTIRYFAIMEQASRKYGDSLNQNTSTNQQKFIAELKNAQLALGQAFLPIYNAILPALTALASKLAYVVNVVAQFTQALFGKSAQVKNTEQQTTAVSGLGDAYEKAGKQAKNSVAGFDEVNSLGSNSDSDVNGLATPQVGTGTMPINFDTNAPDISTKVQEMANRVKEAFGSMSEFIQRHKDIIISALAGLGAAFLTFEVASFISKMGGLSGILYELRFALLVVTDTIKGALAGAFAFLTSPIGIAVMAIGAATAAFVYFYQTNESFRGKVDGILNQIKIAAIWLWQNALVPLGQFLSTVFKAAWQGIIDVANWLWINVLVPFGDFLLWFYNNVITPLANILGDVLAIAFQTVADVAMSLWNNVLVPLGDFLNTIFLGAIEVIKTAFQTLWENILSPMGTFLSGVFKGQWDTLISVIQFLWNNVLEPLTQFLGGAFSSVFNSVFESLGTIIGDLKTTFEGLITFLLGVFTGDWDRAWDGIRSIFEGVFNGLADFVKLPMNAIISALNTAVRGLNSINVSVPDWVSKVTGISGTWGFNIPEIPKLKNGGITGINDPFTAIVGDNKTQPEVIAPLDDLTNMIVSAVGTAFMGMQSAGNNNDRSREVVMDIDGNRIASALIPLIDSQLKRMGYKTILQT